MFEDFHHLEARFFERFESAVERAETYYTREIEMRRTSSSSGAATLTSKHRLRIGEMILLVEFAHMTILILVEYFSMVLRNAA